jgi:L-threonylcarbamoyladenylate synthase
MLKLHYAPKTLTIFTDDLVNDLQKYKDQKVGLVLFQNSIATLPELQQEVLSSKGSLEEAAQNLYAAFHRLDAQNLDIILVEKMPNHGLGKTINDRLSRAVQ